MSETATDIRTTDPQVADTGESVASAQPAFTPSGRATFRRSVPLTPEEERVCDMATD